MEEKMNKATVKQWKEFKEWRQEEMTKVRESFAYKKLWTTMEELLTEDVAKTIPGMMDHTLRLNILISQLDVVMIHIPEETMEGFMNWQAERLG